MVTGVQTCALPIYLIHSRTCVYNINYHVVWSVKYRRKILNAEVENYLYAECNCTCIWKQKGTIITSEAAKGVSEAYI